MVGFFFGLPSSAYAGAIADSIRATCPDQSMRYSSVVDDFAIRIRDNVEAYGCGVLSAYGVFADSEMDRIRQWEDDQSFEAVNRVFLFAERYQLDIAAKPIVFDALDALLLTSDNALDGQLDDLFSQITLAERRRMNQNPETILYMMWAVWLSESTLPRDILRISDSLRRDFRQENLPTALILDSQIGAVYPEYSATRRLELIKDVFKTYGSAFMGKVAGNEMALPNLVYLLPPQSGDIAGSQSLTDSDLDHLRDDYAEIMEETINTFMALNESSLGFGVAIDASSVLAPYILDGLLDASKMSITSYLKAQIHSPVFAKHMALQNCSKEDFAVHVATFFKFLAPNKVGEDTKMEEPIFHLQHNLAMIANWYHDEYSMRQWVIDEGNVPSIFINNISRLPYYYKQSVPPTKQYISELLQKLPATLNDKASFILALFQSSDYFNWITKAADAKEIVVANEDVGDISAPKYLYILTTPFPAQGDTSVFNRFYNDGSGVAAVSLLHRYSIIDLSTHEFTEKEKLLSLLGDTNTVITIASIAAIPLTGGASIAVIGAQLAAKQAAKKGIKQAMKLGYRYTRKTVSRNVSRSVGRLNGKGGWEAAKREIKELTGVIPKRGRPSLYAGNQAAMGKVILRGELISDSVQFSIIAAGLASGIYCANFDETSSSNLGRSLCGKKDEAPSVNLCQSMKGGEI